MRWPQLAVAVLSVLAMIGCPTEFGKEGRVSKAVGKDSLELVREVCPEKKYWEVCYGPNKDPDECRECGG